MGRRVAGLTRAALASAACALALGWAALPSAPAQPVSTIYTTDADAALSERIAQSLERLALIDLRMRRSADPNDYQVAAMLFEYASRLDPDNADLPRRIAAAAYVSGNEPLLDAATRRVVRLDPKDTVAQLRLITSLIAKQATTEARLERYDQFLGPEGQKIDASVRSRLAVDAALLLRERGDLDGFVDRLTLAMDLDRTNKDAASLAVRFFNEHVDDPVGLLELQLDLLYADPLDPHVRRAIALALAEQGAYRQAMRMMLGTRQIYEKYGSPPLELDLERMSLAALYESPHKVLESLNDLRTGITERVQAERDAAEARGVTPGELPVVETARLPLEFERIRLALAVAVGDDATARASLDDLTAAMAEGVETLRVEAREGTTRSPEERFSEYLNYFMTVQAARALAGLDMDQVGIELNELLTQYPWASGTADFLEPWVLYHQGHYQAVLEVSDQLEDASASALIRARALEALGRIEEATALYAETAHLAPYNPSGVWAGLRAIEIAGESALLTEDGRRMGEMIDRLPEWLDRMVTQPSSFMSLTVRPHAVSIPAHEPAKVTITVRNTSPIPLAVGADRVIGSRFLLSPSLDAEIRGFVGTPHPEVLELDQRLRLEPRETITTTVIADPGLTGWLIELNAKLTIRQRWRLLQSFTAGPRSGALIADPMSLSAETGAVRRLSLPEARLSPDELAFRVRRDDPLTFPRTLVGVRAHLLGPDSSAARAGNLDGLIDALIERYDGATPIERALMLIELPHGRQVPAFERFDAHTRASVLGAHARDADGLVCALVLTTRVVDLADESFAAAEFSGLPLLSEFSKTLRARYLSGSPGYAAATSDVNVLAGPTPGRHRQTSDATTP